MRVACVSIVFPISHSTLSGVDVLSAVSYGANHTIVSCGNLTPLL